MQSLGLLLVTLSAVAQPSAYQGSTPSVAAVRGGASADEGSTPGMDVDRQADLYQRAALEQLARVYRMRVYRTFRQHRAEHDRRRAAWYRILASWEAAGSPPDQRDKLIAWLRAAILASTPDSLGPLPEDPRFEADTPTPLSVVQQRPATFDQGPAYIRLPSQVAQTPPPQPSPELAVLRRGQDARTVTRQRPPSHAQWPPVVIHPAELPLRRPAVFPAPPSHIEGSKRSVSPGRQSTLPCPPSEAGPANAEKRETTPTIGRALNEPSTGPLAAAAASLDRPVMQLARPSKTLSASTEKQTIPPGHQLQGPSTEPWTRRAALPGTDQRLVAAFPQIDVAQRSPLLARRPTPLRPPSAAVQAGAETPETTPRATGVTPVPLRQLNGPSLAPKVAPHAQVNRAELAARIAGHNLALRALEAELDKQQLWNAQRLAPLVTRLSLLAVRRNDCLLFRDLIPEHERALVGEPESLRPVMAQLDNRILEARARAAGPHFTGTARQRTAELRLLDELSRSLDELISAGR